MKDLMIVDNKVIKISDYLTVAQAARESDRSEGSIRKRMQDGKLDYIKVSYAVLIPKNEVQKLRIKNLTQENLKRDDN